MSKKIRFVVDINSNRTKIYAASVLANLWYREMKEPHDEDEVYITATNAFNDAKCCEILSGMVTDMVTCERCDVVCLFAYDDEDLRARMRTMLAADIWNKLVFLNTPPDIDTYLEHLLKNDGDCGISTVACILCDALVARDNKRPGDVFMTDELKNAVYEDLLRMADGGRYVAGL